MSVVKMDETAKRGAAPSDTENSARGAEAPVRRRGARSGPRVGAAALLVLLGTIAFGHWLMNRWSHVYIDDSRIATDVITVSSEVAGRVTAVSVVAGDRVDRDDLLVRIESREAALVLQEIEAQIARIKAAQSQLRAQQAMVRQQVKSKLTVANAQLEAAEADHRASAAERESVRSEYARVNALYERGIIPSQRFEDTRARLVGAEQRALRIAAEVEMARAAAAVIRAEGAQIEVLDRQIEALAAEEEALLARREQQRLDLEKRELRAAFDGVIDQTFVDGGEYVAAGTRLFMYHDPGKVWVDANVKETEFGRLRLDAPATITVDAYPGRAFRGKVLRLGHAATSQFALLPSPNPSGNFTKVTQRLPVRIAIEQDRNLLRPGMMVEVVIDVVD